MSLSGGIGLSIVIWEVAKPAVGIIIDLFEYSYNVQSNSDAVFLAVGVATRGS